MRVISRDTIPVLDLVDLKGVSRLTGISAYQDVLILWDEDSDVRVLEVIDGMEADEQINLVAVHEHEGTIEFFWNDARPPQRFVDGVSILGDWWSAEHHFIGDRK